MVDSLEPAAEIAAAEEAMETPVAATATSAAADAAGEDEAKSDDTAPREVDVKEVDGLFYPYVGQDGVTKDSYLEARKKIMESNGGTTMRDEEYVRKRQALLEAKYESVVESMHAADVSDSLAAETSRTSKQAQQAHTSDSSGSNGSGVAIPAAKTPRKKAQSSAEEKKEIVAFAFDGIHHIFTEAVGDQVSICVFCPDLPNMLAFVAGRSIMVSNNCQHAPAVNVLMNGHEQTITCIDWAPGGQYLLSAARDSTCIVWDVRTGQQIRSFKLPSKPLCVRFLPGNATNCAFGCEDGKVRLYALSVGKTIQTTGPNTLSARFTLSLRRSDVSTNHDFDQITQLVFCPSGDFLYVADSKGRVGRWRINESSGLIEPSTWVSPGFVISVAVTALRFKQHDFIAGGPSILVSGGTHIAIVSAGEADMRVLVRSTVKKGWNGALATFCPEVQNVDETFVAVGDIFGAIHFFTTKFHGYNFLQGHSAPIQALCWNTPGTLLASTDVEGTVIIWRRGHLQLNWDPCTLAPAKGRVKPTAK